MRTFLKYSFWIIAALCVGGYLWRSQFSLDLTDEPFYLVQGWKLLSLGDRPFLDEIYNGPRHHDLLNHLFVASWLPYSILTLRRAAVILYAAILLVFCAVSFRKQWGVTAAMVFSGCLIFDVFLMPTWSYNWWCRNAILLHHLFFLFSEKYPPSHRKRALVILAGLSLGIAMVAYYPLILLLPCLTIISIFKRNLKNDKIYLLSISLIVVWDLLYVISPSHFSDWRWAMHAMGQLGYSEVTSFDKIGVLIKAVLGNFSFWILLLFLFRPWAKIAWVVNTLFAILLINNFYHYQEFDYVFNTFIALGFACALYLVRNETNAMVSALAAIGMGMASVNRELALFWMMPSLIVPGVVAFKNRLNSTTEKGLMLFALFFICLGAFNHQRRQSYYDVPPGNCDTRLKMPPLEGIQTSPRRAYLTEKIYNAVADKSFVLSYPDLPGTFYFGNTRPSVDTTMVEPSAPRELHLHSLRKMAQRKRFPERIIRAKIHPWYWGIHHPLSETPMAVPPNDPYLRFTDCVRLKTLVNEAELEVIEPDPTKFEICMGELSL